MYFEIRPAGRCANIEKNFQNHLQCKIKPFYHVFYINQLEITFHAVFENAQVIKGKTALEI